MEVDNELKALTECHALLSVLDDETKNRVLNWLITKFNLKMELSTKIADSNNTYNVNKLNQPAIADSKSNSKANKKGKPKEQKSKGKGINYKFLADLNFKPKGKESLEEFITKNRFESNPEKILGIIYYCKEILKIDQVNMDHIFTGLKEIKTPIPTSFYQVVVNIKNRNHWIVFDKTDDISLSIQGSNYLEYDLPKKK
ncbi:MAG TPA: hypothetical protein VNB90_02315 [Cytophagaceae bacterium]|nr:hypothetical protein [Cytophagaceae bacterium]